jgi:hypothetical protein
MHQEFIKRVEHEIPEVGFKTQAHFAGWAPVMY